MKVNIKSFLSVLISLTFVVPSAFAQKNLEKNSSKEKWSHVTIRAMVANIDLTKREVTLYGSQGNLVTVEVDESVNSLKEIELGDFVSTDYWTYMKAEFRAPTPTEMKTPLEILTEGGKVLEGMSPSVVGGAVVKAVVSIELINRYNMAVTIRDLRGRYVTIPVFDRKLLRQFKVGKIGVLTFAEALALSLEKIE